MNNMSDLILRLDRIRRETKELENDIAEIRGALDNKPDRTPGPEDVGRWVKVQAYDGHSWKGPFILAKVRNKGTSLQFGVGNYWWNCARIVPGVGRVTMQPHDGSPNKPEWLADEDELLIEYQSHVKAIRTARKANWKQVYYYQKLEIKR